MITLYGFGPYFGLPDPSPFVLKTMVQLKMAGLPYRLETGGLQRAPKGKLPFIEEGARVIADSDFIRLHIERVHGVDLDKGLDARQRASNWMIERMLEDHLYWAMIHARWIIDENFDKGPAHFFDRIPEPARETARNDGRAKMKAALLAQGLGRHTSREIDELAGQSLAALSSLLGDQPYLTGDAPKGVDATAFAFLASIMTPFFEAPLRRRAEGFANLARYRDRMMIRYFPEYAVAALTPDLALA